jgi:hypothetical protein
VQTTGPLLWLLFRRCTGDASRAEHLPQFCLAAASDRRAFLGTSFLTHDCEGAGWLEDCWDGLSGPQAGQKQAPLWRWEARRLSCASDGWQQLESLGTFFAWHSPFLLALLDTGAFRTSRRSCSQKVIKEASSNVKLWAPEEGSHHGSSMAAARQAESHHHRNFSTNPFCCGASWGKLWMFDTTARESMLKMVL